MEAGLFAGAWDREKYLKAVKLMNRKDFGRSYGLLEELQKKHAGQPAEDVLLMRISDCLTRGDDILGEEVNSHRQAIDLLAQILDHSRYSPVLFDSFYRWRTSDMFYNHGMSNWSGIPNWEYNDKKFALINLIHEHLKESPEDLWARHQMIALLALHNIVRGGEFGNSNMNHWAALYTDLLDKK